MFTGRLLHQHHACYGAKQAILQLNANTQHKRILQFRKNILAIVTSGNSWTSIPASQYIMHVVGTKVSASEMNFERNMGMNK